MELSPRGRPVGWGGVHLLRGERTKRRSTLQELQIAPMSTLHGALDMPMI